MSVRVSCPECQRSLRVAEDFLGKKVRCGQCRIVFVAEEDIPVAELDDEVPPPKVENLPSRTTSVADDTPSPAQQAPKLEPLPLSLPEKETYRAKDEEDDRPTRSKDADSGKKSRDDEDDRPRAKKEEDRPRDKPKTDRVVQPGGLVNPFANSDGLIAPEVDPSMFEFDFGAELPPKPEKPKKTKNDEVDDRRDRKKPSSKKNDDEDDDAPDDRESKPTRSAPKATDNASDKKKATTVRIGDEAAPTKNEKAVSKDTPSPSPSKREATKSPTPPAKKPATQVADDAGFFGLSDQEPPAEAKNGTAGTGGDDVAKYFQVRSTNRKSPLLYRVVLHEDELFFIVVAAAEDVGIVETAMKKKSFGGLDKDLRLHLKKLDEVPVEELFEIDPDSFSSRCKKIETIEITKPSGAVPARLRYEHVTKGEFTFDFSTVSDVHAAIDLLGRAFDDVLEVKVRWDRARNEFVAK